jgi:hypothetical protein
MTRIVYKSLSSLTPIELNYNYNTNENLKRTYNLFQNGLKTQTLQSTKNYQDVTINNYSCFILTTGVLADNVFEPAIKQPIGQVPGSVVLQSRGSQIYYIKHNTEKNTLQATLTAPSMIYIQPVPNTDTAELIIENKYIQVDKTYPYTVRLNEKSLDGTEIHRQRFSVLQQNNIITFKTKTTDGVRYLALNNDNIVRATGLVLNESIVNDYVFRCIPVTTLDLSAGFIPSNNWVSYFYDIENKTNNKNLEVKTQLNEVYTNYLIDFPYEEITLSGTTNINIANLKTNLTPTGAPGSLATLPTTNPSITTEEREIQFELEYDGVQLEGYLYIPTATESVDVIIAFHGTTTDDDNSLSAAQNVLNQLKNNVGITDKAIVSIAYPQENMLFGDNIVYAEAALKWLMSNPVDVFEVNINRIFLFGHSQGGYLVTRLNTMYKTDGIIASAPGPIDLVIRCSADESLPVQNRSRECQLLFSTYGSANTNPEPYYNRSLINYSTGHKSNALYVQGLADTPFQVARFNEFETALNQCGNCAPFLILKVPGGGHASATGTEEGKEAFRKFLNGTLVFPNKTITVPVLYVLGNFFDFTAIQNNFSTTQTFTVSGENLVQPISITAPNGYHISTNNATFTESLTLPFNAPNKVNLTNIFIRLKNNINSGAYNGAVQIITGSTTGALVVNGAVTAASPQLNVSGNFTTFNAAQGSPSIAQTFTVGGANLQDNITIWSPLSFEISTNGTSYTSIITLSRSMQNTVTNTTLYIRLKSNVSPGTYSENINITTTNLGQPTVLTALPVAGNVSAPVPQLPVLNVTGTFLPFNTTQGSFSTSQTFIINGSNLQGNVNITAPNGFELSQTNTAFSSTLTFANTNGTLANTTIYIRLKNNITLGTYSGNVVISTTNYTPSITIAATGTVTAISTQASITYTSFDNNTYLRYVYEGNKTALLIPENYNTNSIEAEKMREAVQKLDQVYDLYTQITGKEPINWSQSTYNGKTIIAADVNTCGFGCGYLGFKGIEVNAGAAWTEVKSQFLANPQLMSTALTYEFGRNFWHSNWSNKLQYVSPDVDPIVTGYAVFNRLVTFSKLPNIIPAPFNNIPYVDFYNGIRNLLTTYINSPSYTWQNTLKTGQSVPSNVFNYGTTDLFASFCLDLSARYGNNFVNNVWKHVNNLPNRTTTQDAVDNFYIASCSACNVNLYNLFTNTYKWPISNNAKIIIDSAIPPLLNTLFDKSTFNSKFNVNMSRDERVLNLLNDAADFWNSYLRINSDTVTAIRNQVPNFSTFNGIRLDTLTWVTNEPYVAACGPTGIRRYNNKFITLQFQLSINEDDLNVYDDNVWRRVLIHELGHALGIGVYWDPFFASTGAVVVNSNFIDGTTTYLNTQQIYNQFTGLSRTKIPVESSGGDGTRDAHWENNFRSSTQSADGLVYYGIVNEALASGNSFSPLTTKVTRLSITALTDMGQYLEIIPGASEGDPVIATSPSSELLSETKPNSSCCVKCGTCSGSISQFLNYIPSDLDLQPVSTSDSDTELNNDNNNPPIE